MQSVELTIGTDPADMAVVRAALDRFGAEQSIPGNALVELQVVLDEIISNVIQYAWPEGGVHELRVRLAISDAGMEVEVMDDGQAYDPRDTPAPPRAAPGRRPQPGGLGIHLVKQLVDKFEYERVEDHNRVRLTKLFKKETRPQTGGPDGKQ